MLENESPTYLKPLEIEILAYNQEYNKLTTPINYDDGSNGPGPVIKVRINAKNT